MDKAQIKKIINILSTELIPALGCTEPIAIAYAAANARSYLKDVPEKIEVFCSANIIKNAKSVIVPNTNGMRGIDSAAIIGCIGGNEKKGLEVLSEVSQNDIDLAKKLIEENICSVNFLSSKHSLHIIVKAWKNDHYSSVEIKDSHLNIVKICKDDEIIYVNEEDNTKNPNSDSYEFLTVSKILEFAESIDLNLVKDIIDRQIKYNISIAEEGIKNTYGASVGKTLLDTYGTDNVKVLARAYAAAGSDARMNGCTMPVVINCGSGNQGITVSVPVIVYAHKLGVDNEKLYRALIISNLVSLHQKAKIGRLSAFCGAVTAACGAGAGITYLYGGSQECINHTISNILANISGMICDGAKSSCAAKISSAIEAAILADDLSRKGLYFKGGDGIIHQNIESTIDNVGVLASQGMKETDQEIVQLMMK